MEQLLFASVVEAAGMMSDEVLCCESNLQIIHFSVISE